MSKKTKKNNTGLATVHNITDAIKQQDALVGIAVEPATARSAGGGKGEPKRRKGLARCYNLNRAAGLVRATLEVRNMRTSILALNGWRERLSKVAAAQHAANAFAADHVERHLIPSYLLPEAMQLTIARCMDYKVTAEEAADMVNAAMNKKIAQVCSGKDTDH